MEGNHKHKGLKAMTGTQQERSRCIRTRYMDLLLEKTKQDAKIALVLDR
jgi:hypothetical protein